MEQRAVCLKLQVAGCRLQVAGYRLQVLDRPGFTDIGIII